MENTFDMSSHIARGVQKVSQLSHVSSPPPHHQSQGNENSPEDCLHYLTDNKGERSGTIKYIVSHPFGHATVLRK